MASASAPASDTRRKRQITYGKQTRKIRRDLPFDPDASDSKHQSVASRLPAVSASPKPKDASLRRRASPSFDVPSSDDEQPVFKTASKSQLSRRVQAEHNLQEPPATSYPQSDDSRNQDGRLQGGKFSAARPHSIVPEPVASQTRDSSKGSERSGHKRKRQVGEVRRDKDGHKRSRGAPSKEPPSHDLNKRDKPMGKSEATGPSMPHQTNTVRPNLGASTLSKMGPGKGLSFHVAAELDESGAIERRETSMSSANEPWDVSASDVGSDAVLDKKAAKYKDRRNAMRNNLGSPIRNTGPSPRQERKQSVARKEKKILKGPNTDPSLRDRSESVTEDNRHSTPMAATMLDSISDNSNLPNTPPAQLTRHSTPSSQPRGVTTPRQARLWTDLLQSDEPLTTPNTNLRLLRVSAEGDPGSEQTPRRGRLIDTLMPSAPQSSEDLSDSEDSLLSQENDGGNDQSDDSQALKLSQNRQAMDDFSQQSLEPSRTAIGPKFTYGGQRTHLADANDDLDSLLAQPIEIDTSPTILASRDEANAFRDRTRTGTQPDVDEDEDGTKAVRTIHDLRAGGDAERFTDEVNEIIDDLEPSKSTVSRKRAALLDLCQKLRSPSFRMRFIHGGYESRVFQHCSSEPDVVVGSVAAALAIIILGSEGARCNPSHLYKAGILTILLTLLDHNEDLTSIARARRSKMSRIGHESVDKLVKQMAEVPSWATKNLDSPSPMSLAICTLDLSIRKLRESGNAESLLDGRMLSKLLDILDITFQGAVDKEVQTFDTSKLSILETILSILESCTTVSSCALDSALWDSNSLERLVDHLDSAMAVEIPRERPIKQLIPRLSLNLANNNEKASANFAKPSYVRRLTAKILDEFELLVTLDDGDEGLEILLLSLGAMLNLAECSDEVRQTLSTHAGDLLDALIAVFLRGRKQTGEADSLAASQANVAYGWLAVLLGNLCQNASIRRRMRETLPGNGLGAIVEAVDEFIAHHKEADKSAQSNEAYVTFTNRLQTVAAMLRSL